MRFHVVALPHTQTNEEHQTCAYTMKVLHFCQMMSSLGHTVFHYGAEGSQIDTIEFITQKEQELCFGIREPNSMYSLDWTGASPYWTILNRRVSDEINKRKEPKDFLCVIAGHLHRPIAEQTGLMAVEYGIGYFGTFSNYRVFESYSHMHHVIGKQAGNKDVNGGSYDVVIQNYFDPKDYVYKKEKQDYYLYLGRIIQRKGINIAVETCKAIGAKLILAGQGAKQVGNKIIADDGSIYQGDNLQYVGAVLGEQRSELIRNAKALFAPTIYIEPFGGVAVEAQFAGTPPITTDWGAFTETVKHGVTGYRCRTLDHFIWAAQNVGSLDPAIIHKHAMDNYSMERVKWQYEEYFKMLYDLWDKGWNTVHPERSELDWLRRY